MHTKRLRTAKHLHGPLLHSLLPILWISKYIIYYTHYSAFIFRIFIHHNDLKHVKTALGCLCPVASDEAITILGADRFPEDKEAAMVAWLGQPLEGSLPVGG